MTKDEALRMALDALELNKHNGWDVALEDEPITTDVDISIRDVNKPNDIAFMQEGTPVLEIKADGTFLVKGKMVEQDQALYSALCYWMYSTGMFSRGFVPKHMQYEQAIREAAELFESMENRQAVINLHDFWDKAKELRTLLGEDDD